MKRINKNTLVLLASALLFPGLLLVSGQQGQGQQGSGIQAVTFFSPVPIWPPDGNIPESLQKQYVFYELSTNSYILSYPDTLGNPQGSGQRISPIRISRQNNVKPKVSVQISEADGLYHYIYQVQNDSSAKTAINLVDIAVGVESKSEFTRTSLWYGLKAPGAFAKQVAILGAPMASHMGLFSSPEGEIAPGKTATGLHITSDFKPGFTTAFFKGGGPLSLSSDVPEEVLNQLQPLMTFEQNSQSVLTLGPIFPKDASKVSIASNFHTALALLSGIGAVYAPTMPERHPPKIIGMPLDLDSPFVKEADANLLEFMAMGASANASQTWTDVKAKPANDLERQIAVALALAMKD